MFLGEEGMVKRGRATQQDHYPVMLEEVLRLLEPKDGQVYVDATFGAGGYTRAILEAANCTVVAIDRDVSVQEKVVEFKKIFGSRFIFLHGRFGDVQALLLEKNIAKVDGFVLDIGVSSMQLDKADRGFSFRMDGPLDMRMNKEDPIKTAADIVNTYEEKELADLIYLYGQERHSRKIARKIVKLREEKPFVTTLELAQAIRSVVPKSPRDKTDQATRTFQALRIAVNDELGELERALTASEKILKAGGRLIVVSFHSLEDGRVKEFLKSKSGESLGRSRHLPPSDKDKIQAVFTCRIRKALKPSSKEEAENPRSRSARLRFAERLVVKGEG